MFDASTLALAYLLAEWAIRIVMVVVIPLRRPPEAARSWLLLVLFLPIPALVAYRLIGRARFPQWRRELFKETEADRRTVADTLAGNAPDETPLAHFARTLGGSPATSGNRARLIADYETSIEAMIAAIDDARVRVHLLTYIFADDRTGRAVAEALGRARARGIEVRILIDALGSRPWLSRTLTLLHGMGIDARAVLPVRLAGLRRTRGDLRNHRKLCLIDGRTGFVGSQNVVDRDFKPGIVNDELVASVEGPVVAALDAVFSTDWYLETRTMPAPLPVAPSSGQVVAQAMPSGPDFETPGAERLLVELVHRSVSRVRIVSPYLIPDEALLTAMKNAVARGIEVDLIVSRIVDQRLVGLAQHSYYEELLVAGIRIHRYRDHLLHAKNVAIDGRIGVVGSSNADVRSFVLNAEVSLILHDENAAGEIDRIQEAYIAGSDQLLIEEWRRRPKRLRLAENLARLVSPLL